MNSFDLENIDSIESEIYGEVLYEIYGNVLYYDNDYGYEYIEGNNKIATFDEFNNEIIKLFNKSFDTYVFTKDNTMINSDFCKLFLPKIYNNHTNEQCIIKEKIYGSNLSCYTVCEIFVGPRITDTWKGDMYPCINVGSQDLLTLTSIHQIENKQCVPIKYIENLSIKGFKKNSFLLSEIECSCMTYAQFVKFDSDIYFGFDFNAGGSSGMDKIEVYDILCHDFQYFYEIVKDIDSIFKVYDCGSKGMECVLYVRNDTLYQDCKIELYVDNEPKKTLIVQRRENNNVSFYLPEGKKIEAHVMPYDYDINMTYVDVTGDFSMNTNSNFVLNLKLSKHLPFDYEIYIDYHFFWQGYSESDEWYSSEILTINAGEIYTSKTWNVDGLTNGAGYRWTYGEVNISTSTVNDAVIIDNYYIYTTKTNYIIENYE